MNIDGDRQTYRNKQTQTDTERQRQRERHTDRDRVRTLNTGASSDIVFPATFSVDYTFFVKATKTHIKRSIQIDTDTDGAR